MARSSACPCGGRHTTPGATAKQRADKYGRDLRAYWASKGVTLR